METVTSIYKSGETAHILNIYDLTCLYCGKIFKRNGNDKQKDKIIACGWCGEKHINQSDRRFDLKKNG